MKTIFKFGEDVEGYDIAVLNEREVRAAAGMVFLLMFISIMVVILKGNFLLLKYAIILFLTDFSIRVFINPRFSPTLIFGRLVVRKQKPEYVGAAQKKFAWKIGVGMAVIMFILMIVINSYSIITGLICMICLVFLFFESAFGICLGCKFYPLFYKEKVRYCPGEVCELKDRQEIQKTNFLQILILFGFILIMALLIYFLQDVLSRQPQDLWKMIAERRP